MRLIKYYKLLIVLIISTVLVAGCSKPAPVDIPKDIPKNMQSTDQFELVRKAADQYLSGNMITTILPEQLYEEYIAGKKPQYLLVDIRASEDFITSNIRGAINIPYAQTMNLKKLESLPKDKTMVIIDYNGHWAAQTAASWNMLGIKAVPLKYGIQGWTKEAAPAGHEVFPSKALENTLVQTETVLGEYSLPELKLPKGKVEEILRILSGAYVDRNYKGYMEAEDLMKDISDGTSANEHYLVDIRKLEHYKSGHIEGSVNIPLSELAKVQMLKALPLDKKIILIGYDGMDASQGARILVTLGYDATALKYGISLWNGNEEVTGTKPIESLVKDYFQLTPLNYAKPSSGPAGCG